MMLQGWQRRKGRCEEHRSQHTVLAAAVGNRVAAHSCTATGGTRARNGRCAQHKSMREATTGRATVGDRRESNTLAAAGGARNLAAWTMAWVKPGLGIHPFTRLVWMGYYYCKLGVERGTAVSILQL